MEPTVSFTNWSPYCSHNLVIAQKDISSIILPITVLLNASQVLKFDEQQLSLTLRWEHEASGTLMGCYPQKCLTTFKLKLSEQLFQVADMFYCLQKIVSIVHIPWSSEWNWQLSRDVCLLLFRTCLFSLIFKRLIFIIFLIERNLIGPILSDCNCQ